MGYGGYIITNPATSTITVPAGANPITISSQSLSSYNISVSNVERMKVIVVADDELSISFFGDSDGQSVKAELQADGDLSPMELLRMNTLVSFFMQNNLGAINPIGYIRRYGLERHFRFSAV